MNTRLKLALSLAAAPLAFGETAPDSLAPNAPAPLASPIASPPWRAPRPPVIAIFRPAMSSHTASTARL